MTYSATAEWLRPRLWIGLVVGCVPWAVWLGSLAVGGGYKDADNQLIGVDHLAFYHAARLIRDGEPQRLYSYDNLRDSRYQQKLVGWDWGGEKGGVFEAYHNPPFYALLYWPTAGLSYYVSFLIWTLIGFALLGLAIRLLKPERPGRAFLWALAFYPVFATVSFGQNTLISLAIFAGVYRLLSDDRPFAAGLVAGLLWFKPQLLLGLFIWWAFQPGRYFRAWLGVGVTGLLLAAVSWGVVPDSSRAFVENIRGIVGFGGEAFWNKHSPRAFWALLFTHPTDDKHPVVLALVAVCALASIGIAWWVKQRTGAPVAVMFPVAVFLSLWASPHALIYEWTLLVAAAVVLWERLPASRDVWLCLFGLAWIVLEISTPLAKVQIDGKLPVVVQVSVPLLGLVGWLTAKELVRSRGAHA
jgi:alpha-1,2-mannosyltransferase